MKIKAYIFLLGVLMMGSKVLLACPTNADFTYYVICYQKQPPKVKVNFYNLTAAVSDTVSYDFGDNTPIVKFTGTGVGYYNSTQHIYTVGGTYTVTIKITSPTGSGCAVVTSTRTINVYNQYADLTSNGTNFLYPQPVVLSYTTFVGDDGPRTFVYKLSVNGGAFNTVSDPSNTYTVSLLPGTYTWVLQSNEISESGCVTYDTVTVVVSCPVCAINSIAAVSPICVGSSTHFINNVANCPGFGTGPTDQLTYSWDFGDGTSAIGFAPDHTYTSPGTYVVTMTYTFPSPPPPPGGQGFASSGGNSGNASGGGAACATASATVTIVVGNCPPPPCEQCIGSFAPTPGNYIIGTWVKQTGGENLVTYDKAAIKITYITPTGTVVSGPFYPSAEGKIIDGWQRIEQKITIPINTSQVKIQLVNSGTTDAFFDDIRIHPIDGSMKSYVYDPITLRLMAELDENNYATFYEYDEDGTLIRVKKETERGTMTIRENRVNNSKQ